MPTRRLAAVLFADIVGYTAMMQQNETEGMAKAQTFRNEVPRLVEAHQGEVIEIRGDGALCLFNSAAEATACAQQIQVKLGDDIPLRIGIHLGDVMQHSDHIMGDAVNIASRIESMGVAGAVLLSSSIRQQIKNKPEFELVSLGKFAFKNVAEPMTVYALGNEGMVVPKAEEMKGKGDRLGLSSKRLVQLASVGFVAMALGAAIFWATGMGSAGSAQLLDQDIREAKVAVAVFENFTGDENLDALGYMASEWISSGLRELHVRTVSPEMVRQNKETIGILPDNSQNNPSFAEITGAEYVVTGSYFLKKDSIILNMRLSSAINGEEIQPFNSLNGHISMKEALVQEAIQSLLGYWVIKNEENIALFHPPKYEAYQKYLTCFRTPSCHQAVLEIDPDFMLPKLWYLWSATENDSLFLALSSDIESRWAHATIFEQNLYHYITSVYGGNYQEAFQALDANYQLDPRNLEMIHESSFAASCLLNQPQVAVDRFQYIIDHLPLYESQLHPNMFHQYFDALLRLKEYNEVLHQYEKLPINLKKKFRFQIDEQVFYSLISRNRLEEVNRIILELSNQGNDIQALPILYSTAAYVYRYIYPEAKKNPFKHQLISGIDLLNEYPSSPWSIHGKLQFGDSRFLAYYSVGEYDKAEKELEKLNTYNWDASGLNRNINELGQAELWLAGSWACLYARLGKMDLCYEKLNKLDELKETYRSLNPKSWELRGTTSHLKARVHSVLGEKEKAVEALQNAIYEGRHYWWGNFHLDIDLENLKGYPPFEKLIRPKG